MIGRRPARVSAGLVAALAATLAGACSALDARPTAVDEVATYPAGQGGDAALLAAVVAVDGGCVYAVGSGTRWLPVFPSGSVGWNGEVLTYGSEQLRPGDTIELPGGAAIEGGSREVGEDWRVPASCDATNTWLVAP